MKKIFPFLFITLVSCFATIEKSVAQLENIMSVDSVGKLVSQNRFDIDTTAQAIILWNKTSAHLHYHRYYEEWELTFEKAVKVINPAIASEIAAVVLPFNKDVPVKNVYYEMYSEDKGQISKISSTKEDLIKEKVTKGVSALKFQIPDVKAGSVIYYRFSYIVENAKYSTKSWPFLWNINGEYPVLLSEFEITTQDDFSIHSYCQNRKFEPVANQADCANSDACYTISRYDEKKYSDTYHWQQHNWSRKNVPALQNEPYVLSLSNYAETMYFAGSTVRVPDSLRRWEHYGNSLYRNNYLVRATTANMPQSVLDLTFRIAGDTTNKLQTAKNIYNFLRDSVEMVSSLPPNLSTIFKCLDARKATPSVKEKLAIGMLNRAGIRTVPVLLSTTENGRLDPDYYYEPAQSTTCILVSVVDDSVFYSNPASKISSFGFLIPRLYNGFSWLLTEEGAPIYLDNQLSYDNNVQHVRLTPVEGNERFNYEIETVDSLGLISSYELRWLHLQDSASAAEAIYRPSDLSKFQADSTQVTVLHVDNPDTNIVRISRQKIFIPQESDIWYLSPANFFPKRTNYFTSATRRFPIEFSNRLYNKRVFEVILPEGVQVEELPGQKKITFPSNGLVFESSSKREGNKVIIQDEFQRNQLTFSPSYYPVIRSFFTSMLEDEHHALVLKRK